MYIDNLFEIYRKNILTSFVYMIFVFFMLYYIDYHTTRDFLEKNWKHSAEMRVTTRVATVPCVQLSPFSHLSSALRRYVYLLARVHTHTYMHVYA